MNFKNTIEFSKYFDNNNDMKNCTNCIYFKYNSIISTCKLFNNINKGINIIEILNLDILV